MRKAGRLAGLAMICALGVGAVQTEATAAPQTFNTALPVGEGNFVFRQQLFHQQASGDPSPADRDLSVWGTMSVLGYGVTSDLAVFGALPVLNKSMDLSPSPGTRATRSTRGLGDARVFARYTALRIDGPGRTFRIAPFAGVEAPTGRDGDRDRFGRLPQPLQAGSGSWDPFFGVVTTWQTLDFELDGQVMYERNTEANDFRFGDIARLDGSFQYRIWPPELTSGVPGFLFAGVEANLIHRERNEIGGVDDSNSGGTQLFLSPALQYVTRNWMVEGIVQVPVAQDLNGTALEDDFIVRVGFRVNL